MSTGDKLRRATILIDPGHGGRKIGGPNPVHRDWPDKRIGLAVGLKLKKMLGSRFDVHMTRTEDVHITLRRRYYQNVELWAAQPGELEKKKDHHLFISLHADWSQSLSPRGKAVFIYLGGLPSEPANAINDFLQDHSRRLNYVAPHIWDVRERNDIFVIREPQKRNQHTVTGNVVQGKIPSILIELGFMTNIGESNLLITDKHQWELADAIHKGLLKHFQYATKRMGEIRAKVVDADTGTSIRHFTTVISDTLDASGKPNQSPIVGVGHSDIVVSLMTGKWKLHVRSQDGTHHPKTIEIDVTHEVHNLKPIKLEKDQSALLISGTVSKYATNRPLDGLSVSVNQGGTVYSGTTDKNGWYKIFVRYKVLTRVLIYGETKGFEHNIRFVKPSSKSLRHVMIPKGSYNMFGSVVDKKTGFGLGDVTVFLYHEHSERIQTRTDQFGNYKFHLPFSGDWVLDFAHRKYKPLVIPLNVPIHTPPLSNNLGKQRLERKLV